LKLDPTDIALEVKNLVIGFDFPERKEIVHGINFLLKKNSIVALVGESGSGKSITSLAIIGLINELNYSFVKGNIIFNINNKKIDILSPKESVLQGLKTKSISMIFQDPYTSFDPLMKCGKQIEEVASIYFKSNNQEKKEYLKWLFIELKLDTKHLHSYPHELSGGQLQRLGIALALASKPSLLIADEPTTNLDTSLKKSILDLLIKIKSKLDITILYISHDLSAVKYFAEEIILIQKGKVVEHSSIVDFLAKTKSDYGKKLLKRFFESSFHIGNKINFANDTILNIKSLTVKFIKSTSFFNNSITYALDNVSMELKRGDVLGVIGESGSGKTTLARSIVGLVDNVSGAIIFNGKDILSLNGEDQISLRKKIQIVFQNPISSLNPVISIRGLLEEAVLLNFNIKRKDVNSEIKRLINFVGLKKDILSRTSNQISGGESQRVAIARALAVNPKILILDESISSLDKISQIDILNLLVNLKLKLDLSYIFISHDLLITKKFCNKIAILNNGKIVEYNDTEKIFNSPTHKYTKALLESMLDS